MTDAGGFVDWSAVLPIWCTQVALATVIVTCVLAGVRRVVRRELGLAVETVQTKMKTIEALTFILEKRTAADYRDVIRQAAANAESLRTLPAEVAQAISEKISDLPGPQVKTPDGQ